ncbi:MAG: ATP-binding protein [Fusicatenibacter sp.]|nr:ATP-binding protein [Fusicatenibacter sp.]
MIRIEECILYRDFTEGEVLRDMTTLIAAYRELEQSKIDPKDYRFREGMSDKEPLFYEALNRLVEMANRYGFSGNLWHDYLTYLLVNKENAFSTSCEIVGRVEGSINQMAKHDFVRFKELFDFDIRAFDTVFESGDAEVICNYQNTDSPNKLFNKRVRDRICELAVRLALAQNPDEFMDDMISFYHDFGVGKLGLHKAFRIARVKDQVEIIPITNIPHVHLDDLVGYEIAKQKLIDNTEAFVQGRKANNCLLFGDAGTGKSSSIKGILNEYYDQGLRIIEVYKHQFQDLNELIAQIKNRNYKFIIYMDDLSFEEFEIEYKYLKAVIEGGLEKKPDNILIYATSNRRHLIRESYSDKEEVRQDMHTSDTVQEKLSLVYRFGVTIYFGSPDKKQFQNIVTVLAERYGVTMDREQLLSEANKWELSHGGLSGRTAQQFIDYLLGQQREVQ